MIPQQSVSAGWFPDPHQPGFERWWNGAEWTAATHRAPSPTWDWVPAYTRLFWHGLNRTALIARITGTIAIVLFIPGLVAVAYVPTVSLVIAAVMVVLSLVTIGFGVAALRRAPRDGAKGLAMWAIVTAVGFDIPCAAVLAFLAVLSGTVGPAS